MTQKKANTSLTIPSTVEQDLLENVIHEGYGMRGKSRWIREAIEHFLAMPDFYELVEIASDMESLDKKISLRLPEEVVARLDNAQVQVREQYPLMEGVRSNIIRASILQRLIRNGKGR